MSLSTNINFLIALLKTQWWCCNQITFIVLTMWFDFSPSVLPSLSLSLPHSLSPPSLSGCVCPVKARGTWRCSSTWVTLDSLLRCAFSHSSDCQEWVHTHKHTSLAPLGPLVALQSHSLTALSYGCLPSCLDTSFTFSLSDTPYLCVPLSPSPCLYDSLSPSLSISVSISLSLLCPIHIYICISLSLPCCCWPLSVVSHPCVCVPSKPTCL